MGKILAANHNIGSAMAMVPALKLLAERGHEVVTFAASNKVPAWTTFTNSGFNPRTLGDYLAHTEGMGPDMSSRIARVILNKEHPDAMLVGVSDNSSDGTERMFIETANEAHIPVAAIVESWPHNWLGTFPEQIPTYLKIQRLMVFDEISYARTIEAGFDPRCVAVTGNPVYDDLAAQKNQRESFRNEYRKRFGLGANDPMVLFVWAVTQNLDDEPEEGHPEWLGFKEAPLLAEFLAAVEEARHINPFCRAVVRQKPYYGTKTVQGLIGETCSGFAHLENAGSAFMPAVGADVIFGTTTLLLEQAAFCGTPSLSYLPGRNDTDTKLTNKLNVTLPLYKDGTMRDMILTIAQNPEVATSELKRHMQPMNLPTCATKNVADVLEGLIKH